MLVMLAWVVLIGMIICQIFVAIKIFQADGPLKGIIALLCGLFGLIWGWMNADRLGVKQIVLIWTVLIIIYCILAAMGGVAYSRAVVTP